MDFDALELLLQASLPVQLILAILIIASITSWVLIFEKYFTLARSTDASHEIEDKFWEGEKIEDLYLSLKEKDRKCSEKIDLKIVLTSSCLAISALRDVTNRIRHHFLTPGNRFPVRSIHKMKFS